jgi:cytochrome c-type biogenesis protein CcmH/NrfF
VADPELLIAHVGHWIWQLLFMAPIILLAAALIVAQLMDRRNSEEPEREGEEQAERALDDILSS